MPGKSPSGTLPAGFAWEDPFRLEEQLGAEERQVRDSVRAFAQAELAPRVVAAFEKNEFDRELLRRMGSLGLLGGTLPAEYGGAGLSHVCYGLAAREIERRVATQ